MPYDPENPPEKLKNLSDTAKRQWIAVFNSCYEKHEDDALCHRMAWGVVGKREGTIGMHSWSNDFIDEDMAKSLGDRRYDYVPFHRLSIQDRGAVSRNYVNRSTGAKYDFFDEHYYYPVTANGQLAKARRVLAIPLKIINDEQKMIELGYHVSPSWRGASISQKDIAARIAFDIAFRDKERLTPDEVGLICPTCAKSMRAKGMKWVKASVVRDTLFRKAQWENLPKGWTGESLQSFWDSLTGDAKHKVTECISKMEGNVDDPGAFCASLRDRLEGTGWRSEER